jgi:gamma-glutamylcyclotransferase (GGCT)/AIG2-like uncharacterized protein YtfP
MGDRLAAEADLIGPATLPGRLYAVSWYPGAVEGEFGDDVVHGTAFKLRTPDATLVWLDEYEGISQAAASARRSTEYVRVRRIVTLSDGRAAAAWVYVYTRSVAGKIRIESGRWSDRPIS